MSQVYIPMYKIYNSKMVCNNTVILEFREIWRACLAALDCGHVKVKNVPVEKDGVIDIDEYIEHIKEQDKDWAERYNIESL